MSLSGIHAGNAPKAVGNYPHARRLGNLLFLSGIGPRAPGTDAIPEGIEAQSRAVLANVRAVLEASGARWEDLADVTVFLTDMSRDFKGWNAVWAEHFPDPASAPCRTTVGISALPTPIAVELKCVALMEGTS